MSTIFLIAAVLVLLAGAVFGGRGVLRKGQRKRGLTLFGASVLGCLVLLAAFGIATDQEARSEGFLGSADRLSAQAAGVTDPEVWARQRREIAEKQAEAAQADKKAAEDRAAEEQRVAAEALKAKELADIAGASAAGFTDVATFLAAKSAGYDSAATWEDHLASAAKDARMALVRDSVSKSLLSVDEYVSSDIRKLTVNIKTIALDGGDSDFFRLGRMSGISLTLSRSWSRLMITSMS